MKKSKKKGCRAYDCQPMTPRKFLQYVKDWQGCFCTGAPSLKDIERAVKEKRKESFSCSLGNYYPRTQCFHWWHITPSSEDKGYCAPEAAIYGSTYPLS